MSKGVVSLISFGLVLTAVGCTAEAADISVLSAGSLKLAIVKLLPEFERVSGNKVTVGYGPAGAIVDRVERGEPADVVIVSRAQLAALENKGKVNQGSRTNIAGVGIGVAVRKRASKPDISSVEAFKRALSAAKSIGYVDPSLGSSSGIYTAGMLERLGIAQDLKAKTILASFQEIEHGVENGEIDVQIGQISELVSSPSLELVGPLPGELANITWLAAATVTTSEAREEAKAFIQFLSSPAAAAVLKLQGYEPG